MLRQWLVALALPVSAAQAGAGDCLGWDGLAPKTPIALGTVSAAAPRSHFVRNAADRPGCPSTDAACRDTAFLVPGNAVLVSGGRDGFVCATYVGATGLVRAGWLPEAVIVRAPSAPLTPGAWSGTWTAPEQRIAIRPGTGGALMLKGEATFGARDPERVKRGAVNTGDFAATAAPAGDTLAFTAGTDGTRPYETGDPTACRLRLRLLPPFLLAEDNGQCGGANVSFSGIYRKSGG